MKRRALEKHLKQHGCRFNEHGKEHDMWVNIETGRQGAVPRHTEVKWRTARNACRALGVPNPPGK